MTSNRRSLLIAVALVAALVGALVLWLRAPADRPAQVAATPSDAATAAPPVRARPPAIAPAQPDDAKPGAPAALAPFQASVTAELPERRDESPEAYEASDRITKWEMELTKFESEFNRGTVGRVLGREMTDADREAMMTELNAWQDTFLSSMAEWRQSLITPTDFADRIDELSPRIKANILRELRISEAQYQQIIDEPEPPMPTRENR